MKPSMFASAIRSYCSSPCWTCSPPCRGTSGHGWSSAGFGLPLNSTATPASWQRVPAHRNTARCCSRWLVVVHPNSSRPRPPSSTTHRPSATGSLPCIRADSTCPAPSRSLRPAPRSSCSCWAAPSRCRGCKHRSLARCRSNSAARDRPVRQSRSTRWWTSSAPCAASSRREASRRSMPSTSRPARSAGS